MVNIKLKYNFVESPRKFIIAKLSIPKLGSSSVHYLTIRLRARDFYAVIVDEGEARINYHRIEIESE